MKDDDDFEQPISLSEQLKKRTKQFAIRIVKLYRALPNTGEARVLVKGQTQNLLQKLELLSKKRMKPYFGLRC